MPRVLFCLGKLSGMVYRDSLRNDFPDEKYKKRFHDNGGRVISLPDYTAKTLKHDSVQKARDARRKIFQERNVLIVRRMGWKI